MNSDGTIELPNLMFPTNNGPYGAEILPHGPLQDMENSIDPIVGTYPPQARDASPAEFTGGIGGIGLGGAAEGVEAPAIKIP
jgi:hypothetical protein